MCCSMPAQLVLTAAIILMLSLALSVGSTDEVKILSADARHHFLDDSFALVSHASKLPSAVKQEFVQHCPGNEFMADRDAPFQAGCVVGEPPLPLRRFIFGAISPKQCIVFYESGGKAHLYHVALFGLQGNLSHLLWTGIIGSQDGRKITSIAKLREALTNQQIRDSSML
ncbi:MAG: hypothetical protein HY711_08050 [Candidatus Melainabacteria bacterium]|nr:hypothetical protein [Candidatus Melainabacteria bacterium]